MTALVAYRDPAGSLVSVTVFSGLMAIAKGCEVLALHGIGPACATNKKEVLFKVGLQFRKY